MLILKVSILKCFFGTKLYIDQCLLFFFSSKVLGKDNVTPFHGCTPFFSCLLIPFWIEGVTVYENLSKFNSFKGISFTLLDPWICLRVLRVQLCASVHPSICLFVCPSIGPSVTPFLRIGSLLFSSFTWS